MALREFKLPDIGEGLSEAEIVSWLVDVGDTVTEDQPVAEAETDKALVEVPSPYDGTVKELHVEAGTIVPVGDVIVTFEIEGEDEPTASSVSEDGERDVDVTESERDVDASKSERDERDVDAEPARVFAAPSARRLARELGVDIASVDGSGPSGRVTEADVRAAASEEEPAHEPELVEADTEPAAVETGSGRQPVTETRTQTLAAPATRKLAEKLDVDLDAVPASEERDGGPFVTPEDVRAFAEREPDTTPQRPAANGREERIPYRGVRRTIGEQMERAKYTAPHVTHHDEVDVTELVRVRSELKAEAAARDVKLTYMPFVMKAVTAALTAFPDANASLDEENNEIVRKYYYNLGVATQTDVGLMVPVVDDVDQKGLLDLASEMNDLVQRARDRKIAPEEMQGGTFTITNVGAIGGEYATPIINYPEVAILALGAIKEKPRVVDGDIVPRHVMTVSLSFDHRVLDGAVAAQFTNRILEYLENPSLLLLE